MPLAGTWPVDPMGFPAVIDGSQDVPSPSNVSSLDQADKREVGGLQSHFCAIAPEADRPGAPAGDGEGQCIVEALPGRRPKLVDALGPPAGRKSLRHGGIVGEITSA